MQKHFHYLSTKYLRTQGLEWVNSHKDTTHSESSQTASEDSENQGIINPEGGEGGDALLLYTTRQLKFNLYQLFTSY